MFKKKVNSQPLPVFLHKWLLATLNIQHTYTLTTSGMNSTWCSPTKITVHPLSAKVNQVNQYHITINVVFLGFQYFYFLSRAYTIVLWKSKNVIDFHLFLTTFIPHLKYNHTPTKFLHEIYWNNSSKQCYTWATTLIQLII